MKRVFATREGLPTASTASGYHIDDIVPFVALPSRAALWSWVIIRNPKNDKTIKARVLDVGPWLTDDNGYVFGEDRPFAESGFDRHERKTNGAGIDLSDKVWRELELEDNGYVEWEFI